MSEVEARYFCTYSGKSDSEVDDFRNDQLSICQDKNVSGTYIVAEGGSWIILQGDLSDVQDVAKTIETSSFFDTTDDESLEHISGRDVTEVYLYHEDRSPITSL